MHPTKRLPAIFAFVLVVAACGGGTTPSTAASPAATDATPATPTPTASEGGTATGGGDGGDDDACLNTVEEVSAAFGAKVTEAENMPNAGGGGAICTYYTDKAAFTAAMGVTLTTGAVAQNVFDSYAADDSAEAVTGVGDAAVWFGDNKFLVVLKGENMLALTAGSSVPAAGDQAAIRTILGDLARLAADRL